MADSPAPFKVKFRPRKPNLSEAGVYQQALDLTAAVTKIIELPDVARFHLRNLLDRNATQIALWLGHAAAELAPAERRKLYRQARPLAIECGTILDMIARRPASDRMLVDDARSLAADMVGKLEQLAAR